MTTYMGMLSLEKSDKNPLSYVLTSTKLDVMGHQ